MMIFEVINVEVINVYNIWGKNKIERIYYINEMIVFNYWYLDDIF